MSGWQGNDLFDLTGTKAAYWHRRCECGAVGLWQLFYRHLQPAGFIGHPTKSPAVLRLSGPGLVCPSTDTLYAALVGQAVGGPP